MDPVTARDAVDPLGAILESLRFRSRVLCRSELGAPWGFTVEAGPCASFHMVLDGSCFVATEAGAQPVALRAGDAVILPRGGTHTVRDAPGSKAIGLDRLLALSPPDARGRLRHGGAGPVTVLLCGAFEFDGTAALPLLAALPATMVVRAGDAHASWLRPVVDTLVVEMQRSAAGSAPLVDRLVDIVFIQTVRAHLAHGTGHDAGWLASLADPHLSAAIAAIHREPARPWTVARLAGVAGMSRTVFATRFALVMAESPMRYLARLRMARAIEDLRAGRMSLPAIAERVGYASEVAFGKAFKRFVGVGPGEFRRNPAPRPKPNVEERLSATGRAASPAPARRRLRPRRPR